MKRALSEKTLTTYSTGFQHYNTFAVLYGLVERNGDLSLPDEESLVNFVVHLSVNHHISYGAIKVYLCGVRHSFIKSHSIDPLVDATGKPYLKLQLVLRGIQKSSPKNSDPRLPITIDILRDMGSVLSKHGIFGHYTNTLVASVITLAFWGFLRCSEFTVNGSHFDPESNLTIGDILWSKDKSSFDLKLKKSKTDPFRSGVTIQFYSMEGNVCPVATMKDYMNVRDPEGTSATNEPLYFLDGKALTRKQFIEILKLTLQRTGYDSANYNGHSFRKGGATTAFKSGLGECMIQLLGRWSSDCYIRYISTDRNQIYKALQSMNRRHL